MQQAKAKNGGGLKGKRFYPQSSQGQPKTSGDWNVSGSESENGRSTRAGVWDKVLGFRQSKVLRGTSAIEYSHWSDEFHLDAVSLGVWSLIAPADVTMQTLTAAMNNGAGPMTAPGILGAIVEDVFGRLIPCEANANTVRAHKDYLLEDLQNLMQHRIWRIDDNRARMNQREYQRALNECNQEWENRRLGIESDDLNIATKMTAQIASYDRAKKDHEDKCSKCLTLFRTRLDKIPLGRVRQDLLDCQFRTAWLNLYVFYNNDTGGPENLIDMLHIIQNLKWEPHTGVNPLEFIESTNRVFELFDSQSEQPMAERTKLAYLVKALQRGRSPLYAKDLEQAERDQHNLGWLLARLTRTCSANERKALTQLHSQSRDFHLSDPREEEVEFLGTNCTGGKASAI
jgi:hypothetical protein